MVTNLKNVKHVPELLLNLMPVEQLVDRELLHTFLIVWKLLRGSLVSQEGRVVAFFTISIVIHGGTTKRVWHQHVGHRKADVATRRKVYRETLGEVITMKGRGLMWSKRRVPRMRPKFIIW